MSLLLRILNRIALALALYTLSFAFVFNFNGDIASTREELTNHGKLLVFGPHPREIFCSEPDPNLPEAYRGDEWPFRVYAPLCSLWGRLNGYEISARN
jgi:hypothetical protein